MRKSEYRKRVFLNSANKKNTMIGVATVAAVVLSGGATRSLIRN